MADMHWDWVLLGGHCCIAGGLGYGIRAICTLRRVDKMERLICKLFVFRGLHNHVDLYIIQK